MTVHDDLRTRPDTPPASGRTHEHAWLTESAHRTSLGLIRYVICPDCGRRRGDRPPPPQGPPAALSRAGGTRTGCAGPGAGVSA